MHLNTIFLFLTALNLVLAAPATNKKTTATSKATKTTTTAAKTTTTPKTTTTTSKKTTKKTTTTTSKSKTKKTSTATTKTTSPTPTKSTGKRGLSFNDPALTDYFSLSGQGSKVSWAYNWASDPYYPSGYTPNSYSPVLTYAPMLWSAADDLTSIWNTNVANAISSHGTDSVLAFNEPDECCSGCGGSCMNVSSAVSAYKKWVQPLAGKVSLGAPAVTNGVGEGIGISYLQYFMGNCTKCTVDFIPLHWYGDVTNPDSFKTYVKSFHTTFGLPLWITEFGGNGGTEAQIVTFLENVLPWLDTQAYVKRYAYFMDRAAGSPYLLETNNTMTDIGVTYNSY